MRSFIDAYYSCGPSSHSVLNDLEKQTPVPHPYLGLGQSSCIPQIKCQSSFWFCSTLEYYPLYVRIVMRTAPTFMNFDVVILLTIISHSSAIVLMQPEYRQMNCDVWNQYSQQPRCLVVKWTITSFLACWFLNHLSSTHTNAKISLQNELS